MDPTVAIVIVNWNKSADVIRLLDSLTSLDYENYEIFLVDNASTDDSVERIKEHQLGVKLKINKENLGGTGGFNSGIRFALQSSPSKYIWLLDNDATVKPGSLRALVDVMEKHQEIGLAGSRVLNAYDSEFVVETGANFDWSAGAVRPVDRNLSKETASTSTFISVDYVAVCSALVRVSALVDVGLMDERHFLFWDDMDWGVAFRQQGFVVAGVPGSEVCHAPFTEYRSSVVDSYYGVRNQLLVFSKHRKIRGAGKGLLNMCRRVIKGALVQSFTSNIGGRLAFFAILDFMRGRWGKISWPSPGGKEAAANEAFAFEGKGPVLLIPAGAYSEAARVSEWLAGRFEGVTVDILVPRDRKELFKSIPGVGFVEVDYLRQNEILEAVSCFFKILLKKYHLAVLTSPGKVSPFSFATRRSVCFDPESATLLKTNEALANIWKIVVASALGELVGMLLFAFVWIRGFNLVRR